MRRLHTHSHTLMQFTGECYFSNQTLPFSVWVILAACKNGTDFHSLKTKQSRSVCFLNENVSRTFVLSDNRAPLTLPLPPERVKIETNECSGAAC